MIKVEFKTSKNKVLDIDKVLKEVFLSLYQKA